MEDRLYNVVQVCELLSCGRNTVYELIKKGDLKALTLGDRKTFKVRQSAITKYLDTLEKRSS